MRDVKTISVSLQEHIRTHDLTPYFPSFVHPLLTSFSFSIRESYILVFSSFASLVCLTSASARPTNATLSGRCPTNIPTCSSFRQKQLSKDLKKLVCTSVAQKRANPAARSIGSASSRMGIIRNATCAPRTTGSARSSPLLYPILAGMMIQIMQFLSNINTQAATGIREQRLLKGRVERRQGLIQATHLPVVLWTTGAQAAPTLTHMHRPVLIHTGRLPHPLRYLLAHIQPCRISLNILIIRMATDIRSTTVPVRIHNTNAILLRIACHPNRMVTRLRRVSGQAPRTGQDLTGLKHKLLRARQVRDTDTQAVPIQLLRCVKPRQRAPPTSILVRDNHTSERHKDIHWPRQVPQADHIRQLVVACTKCHLRILLAYDMGQVATGTVMIRA